jgi:TfoX/Sxy family transcriptional regulator of competence genes
MAYDEVLAARIGRTLGERCAYEERRMFGGLAFMVGGHMCCGIIGDDIMVRVGPEQFPRAVALPHARVMDFTGRPSTGMVYVAPAGFSTARSLDAWIGRALSFVFTLPPRAPKKRSAAPTPRGR